MTHELDDLTAAQRAKTIEYAPKWIRSRPDDHESESYADRVAMDFAKALLTTVAALDEMTQIAERWSRDLSQRAQVIEQQQATIAKLTAERDDLKAHEDMARRVIAQSEAVAQSAVDGRKRAQAECDEARLALADSDRRQTLGWAAEAIAKLTKERDEAIEAARAADERMAGVLDGTFSVGDGTATKEIERLRTLLPTDDERKSLKTMADYFDDRDTAPRLGVTWIDRLLAAKEST